MGPKISAFGGGVGCLGVMGYGHVGDMKGRGIHRSMCCCNLSVFNPLLVGVLGSQSWVCSRVVPSLAPETNCENSLTAPFAPTHKANWELSLDVWVHRGTRARHERDLAFSLEIYRIRAKQRAHSNHREHTTAQLATCRTVVSNARGANQWHCERPIVWGD